MNVIVQELTPMVTLEEKMRFHDFENNTNFFSTLKLNFHLIALKVLDILISKNVGTQQHPPESFFFTTPPALGSRCPPPAA